MPRYRVPPDKRDFAKKLRHAQTSVETALWRELRDRRMGGWKFRRQVPIEGYIADFVCLDARLIVEVDGPVHSEPEQQLKDVERDAALARHGFRTLRLDAGIAVAKMIAAIGEYLANPPHPTPG